MKVIIVTNRCCICFCSLLFSFPEAEHDQKKQNTNSKSQTYDFPIRVSLLNCGAKGENVLKKIFANMTFMNLQFSIYLYTSVEHIPLKYYLITIIYRLHINIKNRNLLVQTYIF